MTTRVRLMGLAFMSWACVSLIIFIGLLVVGLPPLSGFGISVLLMLFGWPILVIIRGSFRANSGDLASGLAISFGLSTVILAFALTLLPGLVPTEVIWFAGIGLCLYVALQSRRGKFAVETATSDARSPILWIGVAAPVLLAGFFHRWTYAVRYQEQAWLPDDYPLFAFWGREISNGNGASEILDGFELRYHWLTYGLLGGLDRLFSENFLTGPVLVAPVVAWVGLCLGSIALVRLLTRAGAPAILAPFAAVFATTVGVLPYSLDGLGRLVVSPSHMLSAVWLVASVLLLLQLYSNKAREPVRWSLSVPLGFALALGKITALPAAVLFLLPSAVRSSREQTHQGRSQSIIGGLWSLFPLLLGGAIAFFVLIWGVGGEFTLDPRWGRAPDATLEEYLVSLLPIGASLFSFVPLFLPAVALLGTKRRSSPIAQGAVGVGSIGLLVVALLEMRDGNELWFLLGALVLILPSASIFVTETLQRYVLLGAHRWLLAVFGVGITVVTAIVLAARESSIFLLRPWLLPSCVVVGALVTALPAVSKYGNGKGLSPGKPWSILKTWAGVAISILFLLTISAGVGIRVIDLNAALEGSNGATSSRTLWLESARETSQTVPSSARMGSVAVHSTGSSELTLARWIPEILGMRPFFVRTDDLVHRVFRPKDGTTMESRERDVSNFVNVGSTSACKSLKQAGVSLVWITPGTNNLGSEGALSSQHKWLTLNC